MGNALQISDVMQERDELLQLVSFVIDGEEYAVNVTAVHEIIRMPNVTQMPAAPRCVEGIINLRGRVIPVISVRERFGLAAMPNDSRTRIMVIGVGSEVIGFKVDAVTEVTRIHGRDVQPPPAMIAATGRHQAITGVINRPDRMLIMLDPGQIFSGADSASVQ